VVRCHSTTCGRPELAGAIIATSSAEPLLRLREWCSQGGGLSPLPITVSSRSSKSKSCTWVSRSSCTRQQCRGAHRQAHGLATRRSSFVHDEGHRRACCSPSPQWGAGSSRWRESRRAPSSPQDASQPSEEARSQVLQVTGRTRRSRSAETHCSRYERFSRAGSPRQEVAEFLNAFLVRRLMQVQFLGDSSLVCPYHSLLIPGVRQRIVHGLLTTKSPL